MAVVGATPRAGTYAHETLVNLAALGFDGPVYGVNPRHREVLGFACVPSVADLPEPVDAVVVAIPAAAVPGAVQAAGARGCGGAVVLSAGFGEVAGGAALEDELRAAAAAHELPLCGPNCGGILSVAGRAAMWGDTMGSAEPGPVAIVSQSGNFAINAVAARRGLRVHTVVSSGNEAVVSSARWLRALAAEPDVRSVALFLEDEGDGAELCEALAACAELGVGVAVLKSGSSAAGAAAAAAHTGSVAGDHRVFRALVEEAGAAWASSFHELLELAKALAARPLPRTGGGAAILTCSGGDSGLGADECARHGVPLPAFAPETRERLRALLPAAATVSNPLDYTALVWGEVETIAQLMAVCGADPAIDEVVVFYDEPAGMTGAQLESWRAVRDGIARGARESPVPTVVASTLPELLNDQAAAAFGRDGVAALAGLATGVAGLAARRREPADPARLRELAAAARAAGRGRGGDWLAEHEAKALLRAHGVPVVPGRAVADAGDAAAAAEEVGYPVAVKRSSAALRHKSEMGALRLDLADPAAVRDAYRGLADANGSPVLVERMAAPGTELLVAARADAVVPVLVLGLGGVWTELYDDVVIVPLPADADRVEAALRRLRGAPLLTGGRGGAPLDLRADRRAGRRRG